MGDQGYYDQKFGLTPACIEDVLQIPFFLLRFKHFSPTQKDVGNFDPRRQGIHFLVRNESVRCPSRGARQQSTSHFVLNTCRPSAYTRRVINGRRTREMNVRARHYASSRSREKGAYPDTSKLYLLRTHTLAHRGGRSISLTQGWNLQHQRLQIVNIQQKLLGPHLVHPTLPQNEAQERRKERCHHFVAEIPGICPISCVQKSAPANSTKHISIRNGSMQRQCELCWPQARQPIRAPYARPNTNSPFDTDVVQQYSVDVNKMTS